jgi:hypothetical protein
MAQPHLGRIVDWMPRLTTRVATQTGPQMDPRTTSRVPERIALREVPPVDIRVTTPITQRLELGIATKDALRLADGYAVPDASRLALRLTLRTTSRTTPGTVRRANPESTTWTGLT